MIEEDFYATIKLKSTEEIFAKVAVTEENDSIFLLVSNPVLISKIEKNNVYGYKFEQWIKTSNNMFLLKLDDVLLISESYDNNMIGMYDSFIREMNFYTSKNNTIDSSRSYKLNKKMGYIANIKEAKLMLENLYKNS
jgi:hypothetical protein